MYIHATLCDEETEINARILLDLIQKSDASRKKLEEYNYFPFCSRPNQQKDLHVLHDPPQHENNSTTVDYSDTFNEEKIEENAVSQQFIAYDDTPLSFLLFSSPLKLRSGDYNKKSSRKGKETATDEQEHQCQQQLEEYHSVLPPRRRQHEYDKDVTRFLSLSQQYEDSSSQTVDSTSTPTNQGHFYDLSDIDAGAAGNINSDSSSVIHWYDAQNLTIPTTTAPPLDRVIFNNEFDHGNNTTNRGVKRTLNSCSCRGPHVAY